MDIKFSKEEFDRLGVDTQESKILAEDLESYVLQELQRVVDDKVNQIIADLNQLGHKLELQEESTLGGISYVEVNRLRLAVDIVVSSGYSHMIK